MCTLASKLQTHRTTVANAFANGNTSALPIAIPIEKSEKFQNFGVVEIGLRILSDPERRQMVDGFL